MPSTDPNAYGSSWYQATRVASPPRDRLAVELDVDVCVIGAGLAGLSAARAVAKRGWSVAVLEAQRVAWNASGRNIGFVVPGYAADIEALVARVGKDHARKLWRLSEAGVELVRGAIRETELPGVEMSEGGWLRVSKISNEHELRARAEWLAGEFAAAVEFWPAERVREALCSPLYFGAIHHPRAFSVHALNYALGLAAAAEAHGARIYEQSEAVEIDPAGVRKRVATKQARLRAAHVVLAGNVHVGALMPQLAQTLMPIHNYVLTTAPLGAALREAIRYPGAVSDSELADNHYRVVAGDRLMWSGRSTVWRGRPQRYVDTLIADIGRAYPQLREVKAEYAWTGTLGSTVHRMPLIGEISPGLWALTGFGGHGLNTTAMGGELIARAIVDGDQTWRLFAPFEMVWAGGLYGRLAQQANYWSQRTRERFDGYLARRRSIGRWSVEQAPPAPPAPSPPAAREPADAAEKPMPATRAAKKPSVLPEAELSQSKAPAAAGQRKRRTGKSGSADQAASPPLPPRHEGKPLK
jgi:glycine/D-amino acid oxidase-like deaminating enzyme